MPNSMKGKHYLYRLYRNGQITRSKFLHLETGATKLLRCALFNRKHHYELIRVASGKIVIYAKRKGVTLIGRWT